MSAFRARFRGSPARHHGIFQRSGKRGRGNDRARFGPRARGNGCRGRAKLHCSAPLLPLDAAAAAGRRSNRGFSWERAYNARHQQWLEGTAKTARSDLRSAVQLWPRRRRSAAAHAQHAAGIRRRSNVRMIVTSHAAANAVMKLKATCPEVSSEWCLHAQQLAQQLAQQRSNAATRAATQQRSNSRSNWRSNAARQQGSNAATRVATCAATQQLA